MIIRFFIEGFEIDVNDDVPIDLNYSIADITDFDKRNTSFSKTIKIPGTSRNKKIFGHIYEIGSANPYDPNIPNVNVNFNPTKHAAGKVYQNNVIVFDGIVRLISIDDVFGSLQFEINLFGRSKDLFFELKDKTLNDLDFSDLDHVFDVQTISDIIDRKNVWESDPALGSGIGNFCYPLIDFGYSTDMIYFPTKNFKCSVFLKEIWNRIHDEAGFEYDAPFLETDFFNHLIFVKGDKNIKITNQIFDGIDNDQISVVEFSDPQSGDWSYSETLNPSNVSVNNALFEDPGAEYVWNVSQKFVGKGQISINDIETILTGAPTTSGFGFFLELKLSGQPGWNVVNGSEVDFSDPGQNVYQNVIGNDFFLTLNPGDRIRLRLSGGGQNSGGQISSGELYALGIRLKLFTDIGKEYDLFEGAIVNVSDIMPKKFKQRDFVKMIIQYFNLYVVEDKDNPKKLKYTPFPFFYDYQTATAANWTNKIDRSKPISIKPIGELVAREYVLTYKPDVDFYSEQYGKIFGRQYGEYIFENDNEFELDSKKIQLPVSPPLMREQNDSGDTPRVMLHLYKVENEIKKPDNFNPRIAYFKQTENLGTSWFIISSIQTNQDQAEFTTFYPYAGHLDDPEFPTTELLFDRPLQIYFDIDPGGVYPEFGVGAAFYRDLFDRYSDKDSKVIVAYFNLDAIDIQTLDFARLIRVGNNHFVVQKIEEYSPNQQSLSKVTLIKVSKNLQIQDLNFILLEDGDFLLQENNGGKFYI